MNARAAEPEHTPRRPAMPTGYSWLCSCGWSTPRSPIALDMHAYREAHLDYHLERERIEQQRAKSA